MFNGNMFTTMPAQKLPLSEKNQSWRDMCVDAVCSFGNNRIINGRTAWGRKKVNYDLLNSIIDPTDYSYVIDPTNMRPGDTEGTQPGRIRDINIIANKINLLKGECMARPFNHFVMATNGDAATARDEKKKELLFQITTQKLAKELGISLEPQIDPETGQEIPVKFEQVDRWLQDNYSDIRETWANNMLDYLKMKDNLELKFMDGWEHALVAAEEIYYVGITNGEPRVRVCNPLNCEFDRNPDNPNIEDGDWFREDRWMTVGQILDEYGEYMTDEQVKMLDEGRIQQGLSNQMFPGFAYTQETIGKYENSTFGNKGRGNSSHLLVKNVVWKSMKRIGFLSYIDENGDPQEVIVDETFKMTKELKAQKAELEWTWVPEVWQGLKIGNSFNLNIGPLPNQVRYMDNPREVKLPYVGAVYTATNSMQTSLVDLIKPHQYLYNIIWFRLETELAKVKGKKMIMDMALIPKSQGIDTDKWMYYFDNLGIAFINSHEEGKEGSSAGQTVNQFNQLQSLDMSMSNSVGQYINILTKIEMIVDRMVGSSPTREGAGTAHETAHGVTVSQTQSTYITEPLFFKHSDIKRKVLTQLLEVAKYAYQGKKKIQYISSDMEQVFMEIDMDKFANSDYGVFVTNNTRDNLILSKLENLSEVALNAGKAQFSDVIKMYKATSPVEIEKVFEASEARTLQQQQSSEQAQRDHEAQMQQMQQQALMEARAYESSENQLDRENRLQVEAIKSASYDTDTAGNGMIDATTQAQMFMKDSHQSAANAMKQQDMQLKAVQKQQDLNLKQQAMQQAASEAAKDRALKEKELKVKQKIEAAKNATALKNKVVGQK